MKKIEKITVAILIIIIFLIAENNNIHKDTEIKSLLLVVIFYLSIKFVSHE